MKRICQPHFRRRGIIGAVCEVGTISKFAYPTKRKFRGATETKFQLAYIALEMGAISLRFIESQYPRATQ